VHAQEERERFRVEVRMHPHHHHCDNLNSIVMTVIITAIIITMAITIMTITTGPHAACRSTSEYSGETCTP
jgi:UDP-N-acetylmuramyl pentapeptide phosphotransferase/UDP-N-acetylglucosamine-1-phosphate transferase